MIFIPLGDDNTGRTITPVVNYALIGINILVFVFLQGMGQDQEFTYAFSAVPVEIMTGEDQVTPDHVVQDPQTGQQYSVPGLQPTPVSVYLTLLTSIFMHGGLMHLGGNMVFLWIFGDNIEDDLGHVKYLCFYLLCGLIASMSHVLMNTESMIPSLGASGAIAAVMGAYLVQHPGRKVVVLVVRVVMHVPAIVVMGGWFVMQIIGGMSSAAGSGGGVAYAAHIGGFIAGLVLIKLFRPGQRTHGGASYVTIPGHKQIERSRWE
jgi:membrane associated rhomboid family serine protease